MANDFLSFWKRNPYRNLWQHPMWQSFQAKIGRGTQWITEKEHDIHASALVIKYPLPAGLCWLEVPRGPLFEKDHLEELSDLLDKITAYGHNQNAIFIRYSPYSLLNIPDRRKISHDRHPRTSLILDLNLSEADLLKQMKPKGRYNIRVAEKHGVKVAPGQDAETFHALLTETGNRDGFGIHSQEYYRAMLKSFGGNAQLLAATHEGKVIAAGLFVYLDRLGIYYYGASDHRCRHLMAPYLLQWTAIREAKKRGCRYYDFLGIAPDDSGAHPWVGVTEFKKKFGGQMVSYEQAQEVPLRPFLYRLYRLYKWVKKF